jgi:two-component system, cell cycle sensor histidine kinase and response regulator CckA
MKILHLEDDAHDAELLRVQFLSEWPDCEVQVVSTEQQFIDGLNAAPDLILSDFNMPTFSGRDALKIAKAKVPGTPFVFLSGTIGEDRAIEALHAGAADYVLKDRPKRLVPAMKRALKEARLARERKAAEAQMLRVQRLENIGMLAAGIAHDFNNVLAPVVMAVPLLRTKCAGDEAARKILNSVESSVDRGASLVKQILGFSQGVTGEPQLVQPRHLIRELLSVMRQTFPRNIRIEDNTASDLWSVKANPTQLHQVLLNLAVNARDAMPQGGTLTMRAENRQIDSVAAASIPGAAAGSYVRLEVADTGTGIPPAIVGKIWDPFFTTKGEGKGTGLGLATVRGIVHNHGGVATVHTRLGQGTTFEILLPAAACDATGEATRIPNEIPRGNGELVVVVDDDSSVRDVIAATLTTAGYKVLAAADGAEAVALIAPRNLEVRLLVTDLEMPNLDGAALVKVVRSLNPSIRVLAVSGVPAASVAGRRPEAPFLAKPFSAESLLSTIQELLHQAA